jgi:hypothetical protein
MYRSDVDKMTQSFEERLAKKCPWLYRGVKFHIVKEFIRQEKELSRREGAKEERERQFDLIMKCLPSDAENLSTLTPDQAMRLIRSFISNNPWN